MPDGDKIFRATPNWLEREQMNKVYREKLNGTTLTFTQVTNSLTVYRMTMLVNIGHKKLAEMSDDRSTNTVVCNPLNNGLGFDVTQLF